MGLAVVVTVVCRRSRDASVWESGVVLVGRRGVSGEGRRGARLWSEGRTERISRGFRSSGIGAADKGWRGGIVPIEGYVDPRGEVQNASSFWAPRSVDGTNGAVAVKTQTLSRSANGANNYFREGSGSNERHEVEDRSLHEVADGELHKRWWNSMMGIGQQACVCGASMRWPAQMREAGGAKIVTKERPRKHQRLGGFPPPMPTTSIMLFSVRSMMARE